MPADQSKYSAPQNVALPFEVIERIGGLEISLSAWFASPRNLHRMRRELASIPGGTPLRVRVGKVPCEELSGMTVTPGPRIFRLLSELARQA